MTSKSLQRLVLPAAGALSIALATACGSVPGTPDATPGDYSLTAVPASVTVPMLSSGVATVSIARVGQVGEVMFSVRGVPPGVTATFSVNPLPVTASAAELQLKVEPNATLGSTQITVESDAGGNVKTTTLGLTVQLATITGRLSPRTPPSSNVFLAGRTQGVYPDQGVFTFTDVTPPYDLYLYGYDACLGRTAVYYYDDLTTATPVIGAGTVDTACPDYYQTATVSGTVTGVDADTMKPLRIAWSDTEGTATTVDMAGAYSFEARWDNNSYMKTGAVHALQWATKPSGAPDTFVGYGKTTPTTLTGSGSATSLDITLAPPMTAAVSGQVMPPPGFTTPQITLVQRLGNAELPLWVTTTQQVDATVPVSAGPSAIIAKTVFGQSESVYVRPEITGNTNVSAHMLAPAIQGEPADAATGVKPMMTTFSWSAPPGTVSLVYLRSEACCPTDFYIITDKTSITLPAIQIWPIHPNTPFTWFVESYGPATSVNDMATEAAARRIGKPALQGAPYKYARSLSRTLTTGP